MKVKVLRLAAGEASVNSSIKILNSIYLAGLSVCMENGLQEFKLSLLSASIKSQPGREISASVLKYADK